MMSTTPDGRAVELLSEVSVEGAEHTVAHWLYFPTEASAAPAVEELRRRGYRIEEQVGVHAGNWLVLAIHEIVPTEKALLALHRELDGLAADLGGQYDGWEAEVIRRH
jgi:hypothetical protein